MKILRIALQVLGILLLIPAVAMATLRFDNRNADGPSIIFPGGELVSGQLHTGPEPDWSIDHNNGDDFTSTLDLQVGTMLTPRVGIYGEVLLGDSFLDTNAYDIGYGVSFRFMY